jgi:hypothetical protein
MARCLSACVGRLTSKLWPMSSATALEFEYLAEDYGGGLYWFGVILIEPVELSLSSPSEEMRYLGAGESGAEAALVILKEAVETGNMVLHQLSGYVAVQLANEISAAALVG